ncbi:MAG: class II aldolase/adducin family protein [Planctomycetes bacterium]|nr:class II aldolase/adducin family protein [Planctomycetota bacterium]
MANVFKVKQDICEIGRRIYNKGFAAANDGNISVRVGDNEVLCTPTLHCKGFLKPDDIATIDMSGKQTAGSKKRSSEALLHLEIYKHRPDVKSVVHCHPPHATAFAVAREPIPQCVLPEVEVFLGDIPITRYETPGGQEFADTILPFVAKTNVIILANHGTVSFGQNVEQAYWWTEILDAYCRILMLAKSLGPVHYFSEQKQRELLELKDKWGYADPRNTPEYKDCDVCANDIFRDSWAKAGVERRAFAPPPPMKPTRPSADSASDDGKTNAGPIGKAEAGGSGPSNGSRIPSTDGNRGAAGSEPDVDALVRLITEQVLEQLAANAARHSVP